MAEEKKLDKKNLMEFLRYVIVGGISAVVDMAVNYGMLYYILKADKNDSTAVAVSVTAGFIAGIIVNYILSNLFVFTSEEQKEKGRNVKAFLLYVLVGVIGYGLTVGLTLIGTKLIGESRIWYLIMTCFVKGIVLIWNYLGRKILVYKGK
ncbi:MAG: GtrA family protein [Lachnospiraceae bacterium]|nr:GtrA family protein [Lachnospiraceae bacterium]